MHHLLTTAAVVCSYDCYYHLLLYSCVSNWNDEVWELIFQSFCFVLMKICFCLDACGKFSLVWYFKYCQYVLKFESHHWLFLHHSLFLQPAVLFIVCKFRPSFSSKIFSLAMSLIIVLFQAFDVFSQTYSFLRLDVHPLFSITLSFSFSCHPDLLFWENLSDIFSVHLNKSLNIYYTLAIS